MKKAVNENKKLAVNFEHAQVTVVSEGEDVEGDLYLMERPERTYFTRYATIVTSIALAGGSFLISRFITKQTKEIK
jgi:hypothetical protein